MPDMPWSGDRIEYEGHITEHVHEIQRDMPRGGWVVRTAFAEHFSTGYTYTIGLSGLGYPEIVMCGFVPALAEILTSRIAGAVARSGWRFLAPITEPEMCDGRSVAISVDNARRQSATFRFNALTRDDIVLELADRYYGQRVPFVFADTNGWPCPKCLTDPDAPCTCLFSCWHLRCRIPADPA